jgi:hypothetical protein
MANWAYEQGFNQWLDEGLVDYGGSGDPYEYAILQNRRQQRPPTRYLTVKYTVIHIETEKAYRFWIDDDFVWLPKSQIKLRKEDNEIEVPEWLCRRVFK